MWSAEFRLLRSSVPISAPVLCRQVDFVWSSSLQVRVFRVHTCRYVSIVNSMWRWTALPRSLRCVSLTESRNHFMANSIQHIYMDTCRQTNICVWIQFRYEYWWDYQYCVCNQYCWLPLKNGENAFWLNTSRSIRYILVLAGSESIFTDITEYTCFSLLETKCGLRYTSEFNIVTVPFVLIIGRILFLWNTFYYTSVVRGQPECNVSIDWFWLRGWINKKGALAPCSLISK